MEPTWQSDCGRVSLFLGDARDIVPHLDPVGVVFSSPPYGNQRDYGAEKGTFDWDSVVPEVFAAIPLVQDGQMIVNLGLIHRDGEVITYWDSLIARLRGVGYRLFGWYVWDQTFGLPGDWCGRFGPSHEWLFHFNKVATTLNKIVDCKQRAGAVNGSGLRKADGSTSPRMSGDGKPYQLSKIPDSVVRICREQARNIGGHPAPFPLPLADFIVRVFNGTVLDPFMGGGTTIAAAIYAGRNAVGCELSPEYFWDICVPRCKAALQGRRFDGRPVDMDAPLFAERVDAQ